MKASRILAALVSAVTLTNTAGMSAFAANNDKNATNGDYNYVALGDSIAAGFGLAGGNITEDPALVITDKLLADPVKGAYPAMAKKRATMSRAQTLLQQPTVQRILKRQ